MIHRSKRVLGCIVRWRSSNRRRAARHEGGGNTLCVCAANIIRNRDKLADRTLRAGVALPLRQGTSAVGLISRNTLRHYHPWVLMRHKDRDVRFWKSGISKDSRRNADKVVVRRMRPEHHRTASRTKMKFDRPPRLRGSAISLRGAVDIHSVFRKITMDAVRAACPLLTKQAMAHRDYVRIAFHSDPDAPTRACCQPGHDLLPHRLLRVR